MSGTPTGLRIVVSVLGMAALTVPVLAWLVLSLQPGPVWAGVLGIGAGLVAVVSGEVLAYWSAP